MITNSKQALVKDPKNFTFDNSPLRDLPTDTISTLFPAKILPKMSIGLYRIIKVLEIPESSGNK